MTGRISASEKKLLEDTGMWQPCYEHRMMLKSQGMNTSESNVEALAIFLPRAKIIKAEFTPAAIGVSGADEGSKGSKSASIPIPENVINAPHDIVAAIEYVAKYVEIGLTGVTVLDAPCASAVNMLRNYSSSAARINKFWDSVYTLLAPAKSDLDKTEKEKYDGEVIKDMATGIVKEMEEFKEKEYVEN